MPGARVLIAGGGTGGHLYPALNLAAALRELEPRARVVLLGAERGVEARVLPRSAERWRLLPMQPLQRDRPWRNWRLAASAPEVVRGLRSLFRELDPAVVVGTGGYASGPAVLYALATNRRTALQEQNALPGLVTRVLADRVDRVFLGYPEAAARLRTGARTRVLAWGNPVARPQEAASDAGGARDGFAWPAGRVVALIGGSQGARGLNERLLEDLAMPAPWPEDVTLVWITGPAHHAEVAAKVATLPGADRIRTVPYVDDLGARLGGVTLAVGRAGAMFCSELAAAGVPALLVPFPAAAGDHQRHNAAALASAGAARLLEEASMASGELWGTVLELLREDRRLASMAKAMRARGRPDAAQRIARELLDLAAGREGVDPARGTRA